MADSPTIRRLGPGDEPILDVLARDEADFDLDDAAEPRQPTPDAAAYLADPHVLHWVAEERTEVLGHLLAYVERRRAGNPYQVLVYEIGVRAAHRRRGIGRLLTDALHAWMRDRGIESAWLLAEPEAVAFYEAVGYVPAPGGSVHLERFVG